ncbi:MAG: bacillithiol biosynthesis cysteine-adding enzyme BshC [Candidatus Kapaibacteriota bacterium]
MNVQTLSFSKVAGMSEFTQLTMPKDMTLDEIQRNNRALELGPKSAEVIVATMADVQLSALQQSHLDALSSGKASIVITGQQPGFLGGPLYSLYKAITCAAIAESLSTTEYPVIPIFWIEDNDHDGMEAGIGTIIDTAGKLQSISCDDINQLQSKMSISERTFSEHINHVLDHIVSLLPNTEYGALIVQELRNIYQAGISWSDAFLSYMQKRCAEFGILFFSASKARKSGMFSQYIHQEITHPGTLKSYVDRANAELISKGQSIQSEAGFINVFYHDEHGDRVKVEYVDQHTISIGDQSFSQSAFEDFFLKNTNQFSPNVLLRPLIQDAILPTIAMIVGPGEARYMAQLAKAYPEYSIPMPMLVSRHSCTVIPPSIEKYLTKHELKAQDFFKSINEIEQDLTARFAHDEKTDALFSSLRVQLAITLADIANHAQSIDASLKGAVSATEHGIEKQMDALHKKMMSGLKKKQEQLFLKSHEAHAWLHPGNHLQERVLSSFSIESKLGMEGMIKLLSEIKQSNREEHLICAPRS